MKTRLLLAAVLLAATVALWWGTRPRLAPTAAVPRATRSTPAAQASPVSAPAGAKPALPPARSAAEQIEDFVARLAAAGDAQASRRVLAELRALLDGLPPGAAAREVQAFLAGGKDAGTRLDLTVQQGGGLGDASSLRVFLLDYLGQKDRAAAGAVSRQILNAPTAPDEWAVALRNVAWADASPAGQQFLRGKMREMLANAAWRQQPSAGFLEAFDVIVFARGYDLAPQLTELVRDRDQRALAHAAYLTLDRLTLADPAAALASLAAQPELMAGREQTRANFFARADVREPPQKALLETYLLDPRRSAEELQTFAGLFPNANYMISQNLLTDTPSPSHAELAARDRAALAVVDTWLADPRFAKLKPQLETTRARLRTFVQQAAQP